MKGPFADISILTNMCDASQQVYRNNNTLGKLGCGERKVSNKFTRYVGYFLAPFINPLEVLDTFAKHLMDEKYA